MGQRRHYIVLAADDSRGDEVGRLDHRVLHTC